MNITIIGAGAIGGHIAAKLATAGERVKVVARGEHLKAIRERGLKLKEDGEEVVARVGATDRIAEAGGADLVVLAVKAHQLAPIAAEVGSIVSSSTMVMTTQNGFPWWYFLKHGGQYEGVQLESVDPGGMIADHLPIDTVVAGDQLSGCGDREPRRHTAHRGPSPAAGRTRRSQDRADRGAVRALHARGLQVAGAERRAVRNLDEALGQSDLQSHKRARPCDF